MKDEKIPPGLIRTPGGVYVLESDSHLSRWIEEHGYLGIASGEIELWRRHIPFGGVVVDAGASLGDHADVYATLVGPKGRVIAFEPNPLPFQALALNMANKANVFTIHAALSDHAGMVDMSLNLNAGMAHISAASPTTVAVPCVTLDEQLAQCSRLDFIHLDVEGWESKALKGGEQLIRKYKPAIVFEVNQMCLDRVGETEAMMRDLIDNLGYSWNEIIDPSKGPYTQRDVLALPR